MGRMGGGGDMFHCMMSVMMLYLRKSYVTNHGEIIYQIMQRSYQILEIISHHIISISIHIYDGTISCDAASCQLHVNPQLELTSS